jgi:threonylcarbamoyladenosine tRNA methylthiotransferase MtaB
MPTAAYFTLGCKVNQYETEKIRERLEAIGFRTVGFASQADLYVINTCTVTSVADAKSRRAIRQAVRRAPDAIVVATGCFIELNPSAGKEFEGVDIVVGNEDKDTIPDIVSARFPNIQSSMRPDVKPRLRTRAIVKVQDGCRQFCSYCAVPLARRRVWSRDVDDVLEELRMLADFGYKEVVLAGIRLGSYDDGLPNLLRAVCSISGIERIRLSSIEVWEITDELIEVMGSSVKICRHLHVPMQSADDEVLKRMNRPYNAAWYADVVEKVRSRLPGVGLTTDVMVGFPGETEEAFENTFRFVEEMEFSRLHVFRYSPRDGTRAAEMNGRVPEGVKAQRSKRMKELGIRLMRRFAEKMIGFTVPVLVESRRCGDLIGFTDNYVEVKLTGGDALRGAIVPVRIEGVDEEGRAWGTAFQEERSD